MALRNIREIGDPILNQRAKEVREMTPNLHALIEDMVETMRHANGTANRRAMRAASASPGKPES